jgi:hypothetical protein
VIKKRNSNDGRHSDISTPVATGMAVTTDQSSSLLWLRPITTNFLKNKDLEQIDLFNILYNMIVTD